MSTVQLKVTFKKPMRCPAEDDTEPALELQNQKGRAERRRKLGMVKIGSFKLTVQNWEREDEMNSALGKVTIGP